MNFLQILSCAPVCSSAQELPQGDLLSPSGLMEEPWELLPGLGLGALVPSVSLLWPNGISSLFGLSSFSLNGVFLKVPVHKCSFPLSPLGFQGHLNPWGLPVTPQSLGLSGTAIPQNSPRDTNPSEQPQGQNSPPGQPQNSPRDRKPPIQPQGDCPLSLCSAPAARTW